MTNFQNLFGKTTTLKLDQTFRYNDQIAKVSEKFITQNPSQIKKDLKTYSLELRIQELESKFAQDFNQNTFDEIRRLKKEQNIN